MSKLKDVDLQALVNEMGYCKRNVKLAKDSIREVYGKTPRRPPMDMFMTAHILTMSRRVENLRTVYIDLGYNNMSIALEQLEREIRAVRRLYLDIIEEEEKANE